MKEKQIQKVIVICGQTATGKSALAVAVAKKFNGEVISADSRQVYRGLDIGTGKITEKEIAGVPHHLLSVASPRKRFSVAEYQRLASREIKEIIGRGRIPIICGGTGLYIDSLINNTVFPRVPPNPKLRKQLEQKTTDGLFAMLKKLDAGRAKTIDFRNPRRLVRAIEIALHAEGMQTKRRLNAEEKTRANMSKYHILWIGLTLSPDELKKKIAIRLFARISQGMITEAKQLHRKGLSWKRMIELGLEYRYLALYLKRFPRLSASSPHLSALTDKLKTEIWHYARRQMTWFKRNKHIKWFSPNEQNKTLKIVRSFLAEDTT